MEDSGIVELYWKRDQQAITETASKYGRYCHGIAYNILGSHEDAEESVNDTYKGAWDSIPPNRPAILSAYLGKLTRRISLKTLRSWNAQKRGSGEAVLALDEMMDCIPDGRSIDQQLKAKELAKILDDFLQKLPDDQRRVFIRRYWHFLSISEICEQFGFSKSKVESMLHRTRKKLLIRLKKEGVFIEE